MDVQLGFSSLPSAQAGFSYAAVGAHAGVAEASISGGAEQSLLVRGRHRRRQRARPDVALRFIQDVATATHSGAWSRLRALYR